jgi:hypothetical protein
MNRKELIKTMVAITGGLVLGLKVKADELTAVATSMPIPSDWQAAKVESIEHIAKKYLSKEILAYKKIEELSEIEFDEEGSYKSSPKDRPDLQMAYIGRTHEFEIDLERQVEILCKQINKCAEDGLIEYGRLGPMMKLNLQSVHRYVILFYTASKYPLKERKEKSKHIFVAEGEIPPMYRSAYVS